MRNKGRGGHRPLPNSARDLLPLLQPATKALAQMLAGRSQASGQLNHARNLLAHAERLVAERGHNRLNPAEREEFFEQLARLKLTLADADAEAGAPEEEAPQRQESPPVARERLLEMALALGTSDREPPYGSPRAVTSQSDAAGATSSGDARAASPVRQTTDRDSPDAADGPDSRDGDDGGASAPPATKSRAENDVPRGSRSGKRSERLVLMARRPSDAEPNGGETGGDEERGSPTPTGVDSPTGIDPEEATEDGAAQGRTPPRRRRTKQTGLPDGWVVDEEGFVVPGPN